MRAFLLLLATPACIPWEQPGADPSTTSDPVEPGTTGTTGWQVPPRERGNGPVSTSTTTSTASTSTTSGPDPDTTSLTSTTEPAPAVDLAMLQLGEIHPDPDGKDGGPDSPELLEIVHVGDEPLALAGLEIEARSWPKLAAADLGIADLSLEPGQRLTIARHALPGDLPDPALTIDDAGIRVAFAADSGLRNADGGALLRSGDQLGDLVIYGAAQPAPWDGDGWIDAPAPAPGSGNSLCRVAELDHDDASDWSVCPPSPGLANDPEVSDTTGDMSGAGDSEATGTTGEPLPAEVVIVEVLSNPPGPGSEEKFTEFIEIVNLGPGTVDLATWTIADALAEQPTGADPLLYADGDGGCAPETCLAAGQRAILVGNLYNGPTGPGLVLVTDDTTLANAGLAVHEPVALRDGEGVLRSTYRAWPDPLVAPDPALSEQALVRASAEAADAAEAWSFAAPTPGL
jgi:hypothetical protein